MSTADDFALALSRAVESCNLALCDILTAHTCGERVDSKTLRDISACLKDLNGLSPRDSDASAADRTLTVQFVGPIADCAI